MNVGVGDDLRNNLICPRKMDSIFRANSGKQFSNQACPIGLGEKINLSRPVPPPLFFLPVKVAYLVLFSICVRPEFAEKEFNQTVVPTMLHVPHFIATYKTRVLFSFY